MNSHIPVMKINEALNVLRIVESLAAKLPQRLQRELPLASVVAVIHGLEMAKAHLKGEAMPQLPVTETTPEDEFLFEIIDR